MRRFALLVLLVLVGAATVAAGALLLRGPRIAEAALRAAMDRAGLAAPQLEVRQVGWRGMTLGPLRLGDADGPAAAAIELGWTPASLLDRRVDRVRIEGLHLTIAVEDGQARIRGLPQSAGGRAELPVREIVLADARVTLAAPAGAVEARIDASVQQATPGVLHGKAMLRASLAPKGKPPIALAADLPDWTLDRAALRIVLARGTLDVEAPALHVAELALDASLAEPAMPFRLSGALREGAAWPALAVVLNGRRDKDAIAATGEARNADHALAVTGKATHDLATGRGTATLDLAPLRFAAQGRQPADLMPAFARPVQRVAGSIAAHATASWDTRGLKTALRLDLADLGFDSEGAQLRAINGRIALEPAWPPRAATPQRLTATLAMAGLPPGAVELAFTLPATDRLGLQRARFGFAGGTLSLTDVMLQRGKPVDAAIAVDALDIGAALALLGIDGLSGEGQVDGRIPVHIEAGGVTIRDGHLTAAGPGRLRYTGNALPEQIAGLQGEAGDALRLAQRALTDFHYSSLKLGIDRAADGSGSLLVNLAGSNPAVLDGHPFVLNIRLETNFDRLALLLLDGYATAEGMLRQFARP